MKDSNKYDVNEAPVSGPFAGIDPEQQPVIVDPKGERVKEPASRETHPMSDISATVLVEALTQLCSTHTVQIECRAGNPTHRIVLGETPGMADGPSFRMQLAQSLDAALLHHKAE